MGACHFPFISLSCTPDEVHVVPGEVLELSLIAENLLPDNTFPVVVEVVARLENGAEYTLFGPYPGDGISIPAESSRSGVVKLKVPLHVPGGLTCTLKSVLKSADRGEYVDEDRCNLTVVSVE